MSKSTNIIWHKAAITRERREAKNGHKSIVVWFTGLSGAGKSTLAHAVEDRLHDMGYRTFVLDGDNMRHGLSSDLLFSENDRRENIRRIGEVSRLMMEAGIVTLAACISPYRADRQLVRNSMPLGDFIEIYCRASIETCEARDVKGLYHKARTGQIQNLTGIHSPYEAPENPEMVIDTDKLSVKESVELVINMLSGKLKLLNQDSDCFKTIK